MCARYTHVAILVDHNFCGRILCYRLPMRNKVAIIDRPGSSRSTIYRRIRRMTSTAGCFRCPTDECSHLHAGENQGMLPPHCIVPV